MGGFFSISQKAAITSLNLGVCHHYLSIQISSGPKPGKDIASQYSTSILIVGTQRLENELHWVEYTH